MKSAKRLGVVLMCLGFFTALFGCSENPVKHGTWQSFRMNRTSSVMTDAYHFSISKTEDGLLTVTGYCYDGETEYRVENAQLFCKASCALLQLAPETLPTAKQKKPLFAASVKDKAQNRETVTHTDGTERSVFLPEEKRAELVALFTEEIKSAVQ